MTDSSSRLLDMPQEVAAAALERLRPWGGRPSIPVIHQLSATECGVASLAMVLAYHGRHIGLEKLREQIGVGRDGANAYAILTAARQHGLRARGVKLELEDLEHLAPATILHWDFNHFLVFERLAQGFVHVVDPACGRRRIPMREVGRAFTGVALVFEPSETFEPSARKPRLVARYLAGVFHGDQWRRTLVISLVLQLFALAAPVVMGAIVDSVVPRADLHLLHVLAIGLGVVTLFYFLLAWTRATLLLHLRTRLDATMSIGFVEHLMSLPYGFFQQRSAGDLLMRLNSNSTIRELLGTGVLSALLDGGIALLYLVALVVLSPWLGVVALLLGAVQSVVFFASRGRQREAMSDDLRVQAKARGYEVEMLNGVETLKALGGEQHALRHWADLFVDTLNSSLARGRLAALVDSLLSSLRTSAPMAILLVGAVEVLSGSMSLGSMLALNALAIGFLTPLSNLLVTASQLQILDTYFDRLDDVFDTPSEGNSETQQPIDAIGGAISVDDVSFRYDERSAWVVREVSVSIKPGQFVAIVGSSGSGKSTLAALLAGLYRPSTGRICYDGRDLTALDPRSLRRNLGFVVQKAHLFANSVRANIALCDPSLPLATIQQAAQTSRIHDEIMAMPMQYETLVRDGGSALSGGQRQRLALARALVHRPAVLVLDEATAALDAVTEAGVQSAIDELHCTRIVIAHRLSTVAHADVILVMKDGRIVERGTHAELLGRDGEYHALVRAQLERAR